MHWKIARDPYLRRLAERRGEQAVHESGFFFDSDPTDAPLDDVDWRCTPRPRLPIRGSRPAALLATGALCPVHEGHLVMLENARAAAETAGFEVVAGYLSPGHDEYVGPKRGAYAIPASERLRLCAEAAASRDWISVDPWEALHRRVAVNFTDVAARLRAYLRAHVDPRMEVLYVCGGDNARFALAFAEEGACVVVGRPGSSATYARWRRALAGNPRILWAEGDHPAASSLLHKTPWAPPARRLVLRLEDARAVQTLARVDLAGFQRALLEELERRVAVRTVPVEAGTQSLVGAERARDDASERVITLDPMRPARHALAISRLYALGGYAPLGHVARPGSPPLGAQAAAIPAGEHVLRDDDRATGGTLAAARALLEPRVRIIDTELAIEHDDDEDVADSRDFLLGADAGGLTLELAEGHIGRAPYLLPYVDPAVRSCIPQRETLAFSAAVWRLNAAAFETTGLCVGDLPEPSRVAFAWMGLARPLAEVARWHAERLEALRGG